MRWFLIVLLACSMGWSQSWQAWPMQDEWRQGPPHAVWSFPRRFQWKTPEGQELSVSFIPQGFDSEGMPSKFQIRAENHQARTRFRWSILNGKRKVYEPQRRIYEPFLARSASLRQMSLGPWCLWELGIDPMTNGAPPSGHFWVIQHRNSGDLLVRGASSYGLAGYVVAENDLRLQAIGAQESLGSIDLLAWDFSLKRGRLLARIGKPRWMFVLGGSDGLLLASTGKEADRAGVSRFARSVLHADQHGGEAEPNGAVAVAAPMNLLDGWASQIPHYSTDDWAHLHWAWDGDWNAGPKRVMVAPSNQTVGFKWAEEVRVLDLSKVLTLDLESLDPSEAAERVLHPGWRVVLVHEPGIGPLAVSLVPPHF